MGRIDQDLNDIIDDTYQQGIEKGIEKGRKEGIEKGIKKGIEKGIEKGIVALIKTLQDLDFSEEEIVTGVLKQYDVSREKVLELMK